MIKLTDILAEAPIDTYQTIGNFDKGSSFTDKRDRALVTNPVAIQKVKNFFKNTKTNFDFYFVNSKEARKHTEVGRVDIDFIENKLGINPEQLRNGEINRDNVTIFFTNNKGSERMPLTAWVMAHRLGHAIRREYAWYDYLRPWLNQKLNMILRSYGIIEKKYEYDRGFQIAKRHLCEHIGTFKSARDKNLRDDGEFGFELFAQYLNTGKVTFNPLLPYLRTGRHAYYTKSFKSPENKEAAEDALNDLTRDYYYYADSVLNDIEGNIYVM